MKVLVTGGSGKLGSLTCRLLAEQHHEVIALDRVERSDLPVPMHVVDLLDADHVADVMAGVEAVVHLGNWTTYDEAAPLRSFEENVVMNTNVFESAREAGVRKVVFASSIQVVASSPQLSGKSAISVAYLPLDGCAPPNPTNPYALSKHVGEQMLQYYTKLVAWQAVALRFPHIVHEAKVMNADAATFEDIQQCFSWLRYADAARLIGAIFEHDLTGYRVYMPASRRNTAAVPIPDLIQRYFNHVRLRQPADAIESLIDVSRIKLETGWEPSDD